MRWPWWVIGSDDPDLPYVRGEPGEGKVLVTTRRDVNGDAIEQVWAAAEAAADWDESRWRATP